MEQPRVPAWKRLGLKLKYAQETETAAPTLVIPQKTASNGVARSSINPHEENGHSAASPPFKKRCLEVQLNGSASITTNGLKRSSSLKSAGPNVRKSVSFTPETKEDDGESSNFMQDKWDEEARNDQINDFLAREAEAAEVAAGSRLEIEAKPSDSLDVATRAKKPKRDKKEKRTSLEQPKPDRELRQPTSTRKSKDALDYLEQYHNSRSTWKFNKNREVWLLKHVLSKADIPSIHESALFDYLAGMKSENAKKRMMDQCHDCIVAEVERESDESDRALMSKSLRMDTAQRRLAYYRAASQQFENDSKPVHLGNVPQRERNIALIRYERVNRAAKLLENMLGPHLAGDGESYTAVELQHTDIPSGKQPSVNGGAGRILPKKRKNRTAVVDISSNSEDTSSDSSSDDTSSDSAAS